MTDPILLIPMCGVGKRFKEKGYKDHKAIININGKNMIEKIQNNFPISIEVYIITTKSIYNSIKKTQCNGYVSTHIDYIHRSALHFAPSKQT